MMMLEMVHQFADRDGIYWAIGTFDRPQERLGERRPFAQHCHLERQRSDWGNR